MTSHRRFVAALGGVALLAVTLVSSQPAGAKVASVRPASTKPAAGPFAVGVRDFTFVDHSRPTKAHNGQPALPSRTLQTRVWYPAQGTPGGPDMPKATPDRAH